MFGLSSGEKAFNGCKLKTIDYTMELNGNNMPMGDRNNAAVTCPGDADGLHSQPRFKSNGGDYFATRPGALRSVAQIAGTTACKNCLFADMTRPQFDVHKGEEAAAQAVRVNGETDLLAAEARREEVQREIAARLGQQQITPGEQV